MPSVDQVLVKQLVENVNANTSYAGARSEDFGFDADLNFAAQVADASFSAVAFA